MASRTAAQRWVAERALNGGKSKRGSAINPFEAEAAQMRAERAADRFTNARSQLLFEVARAAGRGVDGATGLSRALAGTPSQVQPRDVFAVGSHYLYVQSADPRYPHFALGRSQHARFTVCRRVDRYDLSRPEDMKRLCDALNEHPDAILRPDAGPAQGTKNACILYLPAPPLTEGEAADLDSASEKPSA